MFRNSPSRANGTPNRLLSLLKGRRSTSRSPMKSDAMRVEIFSSENPNQLESLPLRSQSPSKMPSTNCSETISKADPSPDDLKTPTKEELAKVRMEGLIDSAIKSADASKAKAKLTEWEMVPSPETVVKMLGDDLPHNLGCQWIETMITPTKQELSDEQERSLIKMAITAATAKPKSDDSGWELMEAPEGQEEMVVYDAIHEQPVRTRRKLAMRIAATLMESGYKTLVDHIMNPAACHSPFFAGITGQVLRNVIIIVAEIVNEFMRQKGIKLNQCRGALYNDLK